jgi:5-methylcytosine-specific restriction enzyme subunit McrC
MSIEWVETPKVRIFTCDEHGPLNIPLNEILGGSGRIHLHAEVERGDYFAVSLKAGQLTLRARGYVGYIPLNEHITVYVRPRVPVEDLTHIVAFSGYPLTVLSTIRRYATTNERNNSLIDLYTMALVEGIGRILSAGLLNDYERYEEASSFPRGRIQMHQTIQRQWSRNIRHSAQVVWYGRTSDNACNRCLKYALSVVAQRYLANPPADKMGRRLQRQTNALYPAFSQVSLDRNRGFLADPIVRGTRQLPSVRSYYREVLDVALAIIERRGVLLESNDGRLLLPSLVVNMDSVFERYIRRALTVHAIESGWPVQVLDGNLYPGAKSLFDEMPFPEANPDIVIRREPGTVLLVCDVKNVPVKGRGGFSGHDAINQVVTYAVSYRTKAALLIHPCVSHSQPPGIRKLGDVGDIIVYQYRFNLNTADLVGERSRFGEAVAGIMTLD